MKKESRSGRRKEIMPMTEIEEMLEEAIEYFSDKDKYKTDFLKCLLEISKNNSINGHKHVYAIIKSFEENEYNQVFAEVELFIKYN